MLSLQSDKTILIGTEALEQAVREGDKVEERLSHGM